MRKCPAALLLLLALGLYSACEPGSPTSTRQVARDTTATSHPLTSTGRSTNSPMSKSTNTDFYVLRLRPGRDLKGELQAFAKTHDLRAAFLASAVGSLTDVHLRYANQDTGARQSGHFEILSLSGTLSAEGMHVHLSVADSTGCVTGGHLLDGNRVYTTAELVIGEATELRFAREVDPTFGYRELVVRDR